MMAGSVSATMPPRRAWRGRPSWLFACSDRGGERAAVMYTLSTTAKLNGMDPQAWLARRRSSRLPPQSAASLVLAKPRQSSCRFLIVAAPRPSADAYRLKRAPQANEVSRTGCGARPDVAKNTSVCTPARVAASMTLPVIANCRTQTRPVADIGIDSTRATAKQAVRRGSPQAIRKHRFGRVGRRSCGQGPRIWQSSFANRRDQR